ncbi:unnamed protein product [Rangifer tarandus platyrhynchus]|uniref:Uncharacterized protein n=1 Tax=Rangifer tarandus platyrhynchus TaxID=3082113 RepID=A0AC59ZHI8_RANTA
MTRHPQCVAGLDCCSLQQQMLWSHPVSQASSSRRSPSYWPQREERRLDTATSGAHSSVASKCLDSERIPFPELPSVGRGRAVPSRKSRTQQVPSDLRKSNAPVAAVGGASALRAASGTGYFLTGERAP